MSRAPTFFTTSFCENTTSAGPCRARVDRTCSRSHLRPPPCHRPGSSRRRRSASPASNTRRPAHSATDSGHLGEIEKVALPGQAARPPSRPPAFERCHERRLERPVRAVVVDVWSFWGAESSAHPMSTLERVPRPGVSNVFTRRWSCGLRGPRVTERDRANASCRARRPSPTTPACSTHRARTSAGVVGDSRR